MRKILLLLGIILSAASSLQTQAFDLTHSNLTQILQTHVLNARVNYRALKSAPKNLDQYLQALSLCSSNQFTRFSRPHQIAFLCNAYNGFTLQLIRDHYPVKSIKNIGPVFSTPWKMPVVRLFQGSMSLDDLEHKILRTQYQEPRIHFAIVCGAKGCPPLRPEAYQGDKLEIQLTDQASLFLSENTKNRIDTKDNIVFLSPIFDWFSRDFGLNSKALLKFLEPFWPDPKLASKSLNSTPKLIFTDYDWSLNEF